MQGRLDAANKALKRYNNLYDSLYQNYVDKLMTEQEYVALKSRYKAEAEEAERLIEALTRGRQKKPNTRRKIASDGFRKIQRRGHAYKGNGADTYRARVC